MKVGMSYFGCRRSDHIERELRELKARGVDYLVFPLTETDLLFYGDLMHRVFSRAQELGLGVWGPRALSLPLRTLSGGIPPPLWT